MKQDIWIIRKVIDPNSKTNRVEIDFGIICRICRFWRIQIMNGFDKSVFMSFWMHMENNLFTFSYRNKIFTIEKKSLDTPELKSEMIWVTGDFNTECPVQLWKSSVYIERVCKRAADEEKVRLWLWSYDNLRSPGESSQELLPRAAATSTVTLFRSTSKLYLVITDSVLFDSWLNELDKGK